MKRNRQAKITLVLLLALASANWVCTPPSWVVQAENIIKVTIPIVQSIGTILGASPLLTEVLNDLNVAILLFDKYQATPAAGTLQQIQRALATANANIQQILASSHVSNPATQAKIAAILQLVTSEMSQIIALLPPPAVAPRISGAPPVALKAGKLPFKASEFKAQYNRIVAAPTGDPECDRAFQGKELQ